jgi:hypothetical protein
MATLRSSEATAESGTGSPPGPSVKVCQIDERGRLQEGLCFMPIGALPIGDVMLVQIALEICEGEVRAVARRFTPNGFHSRQTRPPG